MWFFHLDQVKETEVLLRVKESPLAQWQEKAFENACISLILSPSTLSGSNQLFESLGSSYLEYLNFENLCGKF